MINTRICLPDQTAASYAAACCVVFRHGLLICCCICTAFVHSWHPHNGIRPVNKPVNSAWRHHNFVNTPIEHVMALSIAIWTHPDIINAIWTYHGFINSMWMYHGLVNNTWTAINTVAATCTGSLMPLKTQAAMMHGLDSASCSVPLGVPHQGVDITARANKMAPCDCPTFVQLYDNQDFAKVCD